MKDFAPVVWSANCVDDCRQIVRLAIREELNRGYDWTTIGLVQAESRAIAEVVARKPGVLSGMFAVELLISEIDADLHFERLREDGASLCEGEQLARLSGSARDLLTAERTLLNLLGRMSGIATLTACYVEAVRGTGARIYDTRKTTPGWRRLEKYAVHCGGGHNHRTGLFDAILIKDNHLAQWRKTNPQASLGDAVRQSREFLSNVAHEYPAVGTLLVEIEVDTLDQLQQVLDAQPDIILLDNMSCGQLEQAVRIRDEFSPAIELEASGGVTLDTIVDIARTGVDRISAGALTHSAIALDVALDWLE